MQTFHEFHQRVNEYAQHLSDMYGHSQQMFYSDPERTLAVKTEGGLFDSGHVSGSLNRHAFRQLAERLNAPPISWLDDNRRCDPDIREYLMNELLKRREDSRLLVRFRDDTIRAVLSDQYTVFDNKPLIDLVADAVGQMNMEAEVHRAELGDEMRIYVLLPQITFAPDPANRLGLPTPEQNPAHGWRGDDGGLHPAIYVANSEVGTGRVRIHGAVYRAVCSNGAIFGWDTTQELAMYHRGLSMGVMRGFVANAVAQALRFSEEATLKFVQAQEVHLDTKEIPNLISSWIERYGLSVDARDNWLASVRSEAASYGRSQDPRLFDVVNGATYTAQQYEGETRETFERIAGYLLQSVRPSGVGGSDE